MKIVTEQTPVQTHARAFAPPVEQGPRRGLIGLCRDDLAQTVAEMGEPRFRSGQLWQWIYNRGARDFADMTSLGKSLRAKLAAGYHIDRPAVVADQHSEDGTRKWLLRFADGQEAETVFIPDSERGTLCISSQVGCTLTCRFCHTGTQPLVRNLSPAEIVGQVMVARDALADWPASREDRAITNIVLMGMGEPLYNYDNVAHAMKIVMDGDGLSLSKRRITLSTSGVVPQIHRCGAELNINLAISLHATNDETRSKIMPLNKRYPLADLLAACRAYPGLSNARRITFEYVMLAGVNDSLDDARRLVQLLAGIPSKINLIPFNPWPGSFFTCSSRNQINRFAQILNDAGLSAPIRATRGNDILAACGQLKSDSERQRRARRCTA